MNFKKVSKEEFDEFIKNYPNKLDYDIYGVPEPPIGSYNDFSNGLVWPESIVAYIKLFGKEEYYGYKENEYYIKL